MGWGQGQNREQVWVQGQDSFTNTGTYITLRHTFVQFEYFSVITAEALLNIKKTAYSKNLSTKIILVVKYGDLHESKVEDETDVKISDKNEYDVKIKIEIEVKVAVVSYTNQIYIGFLLWHNKRIIHRKTF